MLTGIGKGVKIGKPTMVISFTITEDTFDEINRVQKMTQFGTRASFLRYLIERGLSVVKTRLKRKAMLNGRQT